MLTKLVNFRPGCGGRAPPEPLSKCCPFSGSGYQICERAGEVARPSDVRAGEPDLKQPLVLAPGERLAGPHDPRSDLARARDVAPDGLGGACAEGGEVFAGDLMAAAIATGLDLQEQLGATDLALGLGEAGIQVRLERLQDTVGPAVVAEASSSSRSVSRKRRTVLRSRGCSCAPGPRKRIPPGWPGGYAAR
jgi:hypothetical protein